MLGIILYVGLFVWGMQTERLGWKPFVAMIGIAALVAFVSFLSLGGTDGLRDGTIAFITPLFLFGFELTIDAIVFFIGYGVGKFRRRGQASHDDVTDTFS